MNFVNEGRFGQIEWRVHRATNREDMHTAILTTRLLEKLGAGNIAYLYVRLYARMVTQGTGKVRGEMCYIRGLMDMEGQRYEIPLFSADFATHLTAFDRFMNTDPELTDPLFAALEQVDMPLGEKYFFPNGLLTTEEQADPNLPSAGKRRKGE